LFYVVFVEKPKKHNAFATHDLLLHGFYNVFGVHREPEIIVIGKTSEKYNVFEHFLNTLEPCGRGVAGWSLWWLASAWPSLWPAQPSTNSQKH